MKSTRSQSDTVRRIPTLAVFLLSAAVFLYQVTLTRLFAIAHFYHFAFIIIALALLGGGASGSFLAAWPQIHNSLSRQSNALVCLTGGLSTLLSYLLINILPFDAYAVAIDPTQMLILVVHFIALAAPFFCAGLLVSGLMRDFPHHSHIVYACNLGGSSAGCLLALVVLPLAGGEGASLISASIAGLAAPLAFFPHQPNNLHNTSRSRLFNGAMLFISFGLVLIPLYEAVCFAQGKQGLAIFDAHISPYKPLSYALQYPGAQISETRWNAFSRVDVVRSQGIRSLPGLSYLYPGLVQAEAGLFVDGGDLAPVLPAEPGADYFAYLPQSLAFSLRPDSHSLILEARTGADILAALSGGAVEVTAVEPNPLLVEAAASIYQLPKVRTIIQSPRAFLADACNGFDIILLPLTSSYAPITSGAYSLGEDYRYTIESFQSVYNCLKPDGLLVASRWLQTPPSEFLRAFILAVEALEELGLDASTRIAALRGYNVGTLFIKESPFQQDELADIRDFAEANAFDLAYLPGLRSEESNRFNILPRDDYYQYFHAYLTSFNRMEWLRNYPFEVSAPTDDHPFFNHFFKWTQLPEILAQYGRTWQPFGGAGFLVVIFLFPLMLALSLLLIITPLVFRHGNSAPRTPFGRTPSLAVVTFFTLIGVGYIAVEIPLIQKFILYLGQPTYAFSAVIAALLLFSGMGSLATKRVHYHSILALALLVLLSPTWLGAVFNATLQWPFFARLLTSFACLAPLGFLMGIPLAKGISSLNSAAEIRIPWVWAINGTSSVVASILSAILALTFNFTSILLLGSACYALAWISYQKFHNG